MDSECIRSVVSFSLEFLQHNIKNDQNSNVLISPPSIYVAVAMVHIGIKNKARDELTKLFGVDFGKLMECKSENMTLQRDLRRVMDILEGSSDLKHGIFTAYDFDQKYIKILSDIFHIAIQKMSFLDASKVAQVINEYISIGTHGLIQDMIQESFISAGASFLFINTIFFKGVWVNEFKKEKTNMNPFYPERGSHIQVPFMNQKLKGKFYIDPASQFEALVLEFSKGGNVGLFILPKNDKLGNFIQSLNPNVFLKIIRDARITELKISIPKMKLKKESLLKPIFKEMGVNELFKYHDFSSSITMPISIDEIIHSVMIDVDEEGVVAASAVVIYSNSRLDECHIFKLNRPFLFLIMHAETGVPLFMNAIYNPTE